MNENGQGTDNPVVFENDNLQGGHILQETRKGCAGARSS